MYAIIDVETTGGSAANERITEIAIYRHDGKRIIGEYSSLINPEKAIPPFITRLTGISDEMVNEAPHFFEVARKIVEMTEGCTFVAHNVNFDYQFIRHEFLRLGYRYHRPHLCTVKLSRKLLPGISSYSLGNLCEALGIRIDNRHRAAGDALATVKLFEKLLAVDETLSGLPTDGLHPDLDRSCFSRLPAETGVYYFHGSGGRILYIGKSKNIAARVISHFSASKTVKALDLKNAVTDITYTITGSELVALLLESDEIKQNKPFYNRAQRRTLYRYGLFSFYNQAGYRCLQTAKLSKASQPHTVFTSFEEASAEMHRIVGMNTLCQKLCGLYPNQGACFYHGIGMCHGACIGNEAPAIYNERVDKALSKYAHLTDNLLIIDKGRTEEERSAILIEDGVYKGFGWFDTELDMNSPESIRDCIHPYTENRDVLQIIKRYVSSSKNIQLVKFAR